MSATSDESRRYWPLKLPLSFEVVEKRRK